MTEEWKLNSRPVLKDGKPIMEYFFEDSKGAFIRMATEQDMAEINRQMREHMLAFFKMPAGQLCEWGDTRAMK